MTNEKKLSKKNYLIYGIGVSYFMLDQIYNQWLTYYYLPPETEKTLVPLLKPQYLIIAFIMARLVDAISDPLVGYWSDNSKAKMGKRSFYMAWGGVPLGVLMVMYFYPPKTSQMATLIYLSIVGGLFFLAYTLVGGPYNSLIPDLANTKEERLNLSTIQSLFRLIFTGVSLVLPGILIKILGGSNIELGIRKTVIVFSILAVIGIYSCIFLLGENKLVENKKIGKQLTFMQSMKYINDKEIILYFLGYFFFFSGFNILRGVLTYYLTIVMKLPISNMTIITMVLFGVAGLCFPITNMLSKKYSFKKILILDIVLLTIGTVGLLLINEKSYYLAYVMFIICGLGLSGSAFIFPQAMLSEITVNLFEEKKVTLDGFFFGIQGLFLKLAFLVQQIVLASVLVIGSQKTKEGLRTATNLGVKVTLIIALILFILSLIFYNLKKED